MTEVVLDASAVLAFLRREPGAEAVAPHLRGGFLSSVNYAEVLAKAADLSVNAKTTENVLNELGVRRVPFDDRHAVVAAALLPVTKPRGLSLADRACLALGILANRPVLTADRDWRHVTLDVEIRTIR